MWGMCRLVRLGVVGVVMGFGVDRIFLARIRMVCVICVMMAIRVINILDGVLFPRYIVSIHSYAA